MRDLGLHVYWSRMPKTLEVAFAVQKSDDAYRKELKLCLQIIYKNLQSSLPIRGEEGET
jgi:hypothetical protein